jgi:hypothetical protein
MLTLTHQLRGLRGEGDTPELFPAQDIGDEDPINFVEDTTNYDTSGLDFSGGAVYPKPTGATLLSNALNANVFTSATNAAFAAIAAAIGKGGGKATAASAPGGKAPAGTTSPNLIYFGAGALLLIVVLMGAGARR